jgi:Domain of unknown function (DUF6321)
MRFTEIISENEKPGLWANIHAKRDRIKHGSGEHMRKPGSKGAPTAAALKASQNEAANPAQQAAIAINMKKHHQKPKNEGYAMEDEQIDGMAQGEIREIIKNAVHIKNQLDNGVSLDGWMYSFVTVSNDKLNSVAEQIGNPNISDEESVSESENAILSPGTEVTVPHKGKMVPGKIVRYDSGKGIESPAYIVDISEYESLIVPVSRVKQDMDEGETWAKHNNPRVGGMSKKSVNSYRRSHPGSKIQTAVTTKPSKLKKGSKAAKRRASFCARMRGMKKHRTGAKTAHDPNSNINKSLRRWHCESIEELHELVMLAEQFIRNNKK